MFYNRKKKLNNITYTSIDLDSPLAMQKADITNLKVSNNSFNGILCSHVLEHVENDRKALKEIYRILKSGGWAILQSPVENDREKTFENFTIQSPEERKKVFGQEDNVRIYEKDYVERLKEAGFSVKVGGFVNTFSIEDKERYLLDTNEVIYFCMKP